MRPRLDRFAETLFRIPPRRRRTVANTIKLLRLKMLTRVVLPVENNAAIFDEALSSALSSSKSVFVLFTGAGVPSWCPDCEDCKPLVKSVFEEAGGSRDVTLIEVPLARETYRGNAGHWARTHAAIKLQRIPTLARWGKAKKMAELVEGECADAGKVKELVLDEE
jgi:hypothetical protein